MPKRGRQSKNLSRRRKFHKHASEVAKENVAATTTGNPRVTPKRNQGVFTIWGDNDPLPVIKNQSIRVAISVYYIQKLLAPPKWEWGGRGGTISQIVEGLGLSRNSRRMVGRVLERVNLCLEMGEPYDGSCDYDTNRMGRPIIIKPEDEETQIIADAIESGMSI